MYRKLILFCWLLFISPAFLIAQINTPSEWEDTSNIEDESEDEEKDWSDRLEDLAYFKEHPLNLNRISKEQLELFPFLTDLQIEHFLYYIYVYGSMNTIYELQLVEDWDRQTIQYILPYVYVGEPEVKKKQFCWKDYWRYGRCECVTRVDIPFYTKAGYKHPGDNLLITSKDKHYLGPSFANSLRFNYHYKDELYTGFTANKDAGEPFLSKGNNSGFDSYSFYFLVHNLGKIKTLAVGNYRLNFGQGIVINSDYSLGKSVSIATMGCKTTGIKRHSSSDEYNYFQGVAATYQIKDILVSGFYSYRNLDGKITDGLLTSIKKDGLHRLASDFNKRNVASIQLMGTNIGYSIHRLKLGLTAAYYFFDKEYRPESRPYNYYSLKGKSFYNIGIDYKYRWHNFSVLGENAISKGGGLAMLNTIAFTPLTGYQLLLLHRYYAKDYHALYACSVSEGSIVENENGYYLGVEAKPIKYFKLFAYADFFNFPWLRYGVNSPSSGFDGLTQLTYMPHNNLTITLNYHYKKKEKDFTNIQSNIHEVREYVQQKVRCQLGYLMHANLAFKTTLNWTWLTSKGSTTENGFMILQEASYRFIKLPLSVNASYGMFDTSNYSVRISSYEKGLLYAFSIPSFYGQGVRFALNMRYDLSKKMIFLMKFGQTRYTDRKEIGKGMEAIQGNVKADMNIQIRWKF